MAWRGLLERAGERIAAGDPDEAVELSGEALAGAEELDPAGVPRALLVLGYALTLTGDTAAGRDVLEQAITAADGDPALLAEAWAHLALALRADDALDEAAACLANATAATARSVGPAHPAVARALAAQAQLAFERGDADAAVGWLEQGLAALDAARASGDTVELAFDACTLGCNLTLVHLAHERPERAALGLARAAADHAALVGLGGPADELAARLADYTEALSGSGSC